MIKVSIAGIRIDGGTQPRAQLSEQTVAEYAEALKGGASFPPAVIFFDGSEHWLADGFHRYHATRAAGLDQLDADVRPGTKRDAILFSCGANGAHGLRRSNEDKRQAVLTLLKDAEWGKWSDSEIGRRCSVSHTMVSQVRSSLATVASEPVSPRTYKTKSGATTTMRTGNIGRTAQLRADMAETRRRAAEAKQATPAPQPEPKTPAAAPVPAPAVAQSGEARELAELKEQYAELQQINERLEAMASGEEEVNKLITDLQKRLVRSQAFIKTVEGQRDMAQSEANQLKAEVKRLRKELAKYERRAA